jgi:hypothetical protein
MALNRRIDPQAADGHHERMGWSELGNARQKLSPKSRSKQTGRIARH